MTREKSEPPPARWRTTMLVVALSAAAAAGWGLHRSLLVRPAHSVRVTFDEATVAPGVTSTSATLAPAPRASAPPVREAPATVLVEVVSHRDGAPVVGAEVVVRAAESASSTDLWLLGDEVGRGSTGADGNVRIPVSAAGAAQREYFAEVRPPAPLVGVTARVQAASSTTIVVHEGVPLRLLARRQSDGAPVASARLAVFAANRGARQRAAVAGASPEDASVLGTTDASGVLEVVVRTGPVEVRSADPRWFIADDHSDPISTGALQLTASTGSPSDTTQVTVPLTAVSIVEFQLVDERGALVRRPPTHLAIAPTRDGRGPPPLLRGLRDVAEVATADGWIESGDPRDAQIGHYSLLVNAAAEGDLPVSIAITVPGYRPAVARVVARAVSHPSAASPDLVILRRESDETMGTLRWKVEEPPEVRTAYYRPLSPLVLATSDSDPLKWSAHWAERDGDSWVIRDMSPGPATLTIDTGLCLVEGVSVNIPPGGEQEVRLTAPPPAGFELSITYPNGAFTDNCRIHVGASDGSEFWMPQPLRGVPLKHRLAGGGRIFHRLQPGTYHVTVYADTRYWLERDVTIAPGEILRIEGVLRERQP